MIDCVVFDHASVDVIALARPECAEVRFSPGGEIESLYKLIDHRVRFRVNGECLSACAFAALILPGSCVTDRAVLRFHAPRSYYGRGKILPLLTEQLVVSLPKRIQARLGKLGNSWRTITGKQVRRLAPRWACSQGES